MTLTRRGLLGGGVASSFGFAPAKAYYPPPDVQGGWRRRENAAAFDPVFEYVMTTSKHGGLLLVRDGWLVYERYFGRGHREATPNLASCGKSFTSIAAGILAAERSDVFSEGLDTRVFTPLHLPPEAFPLKDRRKERIRLGQLLAMTAGIRGNSPGMVRGKQVRVEPPGLDGWPAVVDANALAADLWCDPGAGYSYATAGVHLVSMVVRHVTGTELQAYLGARIARPLGWGRWGFGYRRPEITHTPGGGGIALRATDMLRFGYLMLNEGRWMDRQLVPREYVRHCGSISRYNPHSLYSLQFDVNARGQVAGVPRDAFWKMGSGGHCFYVVPSLRLVVFKLGGRDEQYDLKQTNVPAPTEPLPAFDGSRANRWPAPDQRVAAETTLRLIVDRA
jgi:CubicO group peptidase (beta-lactamase class C family)